MTDGEKVAKAALGWLGTPHINGAKLKGVGVDCGMLFIAGLEDAGLIAPGTIQIPPYSNEWHLHRSEELFLEYVKKYCRKVKVMEPGDFLLYQFGRCVSHGAVYVGNMRVVHSYVNRGVILSELTDTMFNDAKGRSRLRGIYRFTGIKNTATKAAK